MLRDGSASAIYGGFGCKGADLVWELAFMLFPHRRDRWLVSRQGMTDAGTV